MTTKARIYLALAVVGAAVPIALGIAFIADEGADLAAFFDQLFDSTASTLAFADLTISSIAFLTWMWGETRRHDLGSPWAYVLANVAVGLSFALPLFLYLRERRTGAVSTTA